VPITSTSATSMSCEQLTSGSTVVDRIVKFYQTHFYVVLRSRHRFLRASAHVIAIGLTSVCPSVRPSVTRWHPIKTAEYIVMLSSPHDSPVILVLCTPRSSRNSDGVTPCGGAKYRRGIKFARFSSNKSLYLANDTRYRHGCYGRRIGNHTQAFEWHQFQ